MVKFSELMYPDRYQRRALVGDAATCLANYNRAARSAASRVLVDDIDPRSYAILYRLLDGEKKQRWLQEELGIPAGSMQHLKKNLVAAGLIVDPEELIRAKRAEAEKRDAARRRGDSDLKRGVHVFKLTARGDLEIRGRIGSAQSMWEVGLDALDDDELRLLATLIRKMRAALDDRLVTRPGRATSPPAQVRVSDETDCNLNPGGDLERENHSSLNAPSDYCANADPLPSNGSVSEDGNGGSVLLNDDQQDCPCGPRRLGLGIGPAIAAPNGRPTTSVGHVGLFHVPGRRRAFGATRTNSSPPPSELRNRRHVEDRRRRCSGTAACRS